MQRHPTPPLLLFKISDKMMHFLLNIATVTFDIHMYAEVVTFEAV